MGTRAGRNAHVGTPKIQHYSIKRSIKQVRQKVQGARACVVTERQCSCAPVTEIVVPGSGPRPAPVAHAAPATAVPPALDGLYQGDSFSLLAYVNIERYNIIILVLYTLRELWCAQLLRG